MAHQDLTTITTPFGLLDAETQEALRAHGGPYEWLNWSGAWEETSPPGWAACYAYRVKPQPPKPREYWLCFQNGWWNKCDTKEEAEKYGWKPGVNCHLFREVLE